MAHAILHEFASLIEKLVTLFGPSRYQTTANGMLKECSSAQIELDRREARIAFIDDHREAYGVEPGPQGVANRPVDHHARIPRGSTSTSVRPCAAGRRIEDRGSSPANSARPCPSRSRARPCRTPVAVLLRRRSHCGSRPDVARNKQTKLSKTSLSSLAFLAEPRPRPGIACSPCRDRIPVGEGSA